MSSRNTYRFVAILVLASLLFTQMACFESAPASSKPKSTVISTNTGPDWGRCASLTCTYKVKWTGDIKTTLKGGRIHRGTAIPLGGKWE